MYCRNMALLTQGRAAASGYSIVRWFVCLSVCNLILVIPEPAHLDAITYDIQVSRVRNYKLTDKHLQCVYSMDIAVTQQVVSFISGRF